jgi:HEAT repeat protein
VPALSEAFLERRVAPTNVVSDALRKIGREAAPAFEVLDTDSDARVRAAAAAALGILGGDDAPAALRRATTDPDLHVRRSAVRALGSFDDPTSGQTLNERTEDEDRETAIRAAEALLALARRPRAGRRQVRFWSPRLRGRSSTPARLRR